MNYMDIHRALSSRIRQAVILSLAEKNKYLTELSNEMDKAPQTLDFHLSILEDAGIVEVKWEHGKKFYSLKDRKILKYLREGEPLPYLIHPKPPHEIVVEAWEDISERLDRIEAKLDKLLK
ncbi:MAG: winged helix-turn-helix transcriptional regulator [Candidatus Diapherotrites archaeon]|nr:winged helix-turn-helix transcriptional regulator [Candidatus Diapherotrites archaeon]